MTGHWAIDEKKFVWRQLDGEYLILDLDSGDYFTLQGAGNFVFDRILKGQTRQQIEEGILAEYPAAGAKTVRRDVADFIRQLARLKLLEEAGA